MTNYEYHHCDFDSSFVIRCFEHLIPCRSFMIGETEGAEKKTLRLCHSEEGTSDSARCPSIQKGSAETHDTLTHALGILRIPSLLRFQFSGS
jgi:hypothetical protein